MAIFKVKDFIKTAENLYFAVIKAGIENKRVLCCLRYVYQQGKWKKFDTILADLFLQQHYPHYLYYSKLIDAQVHGVAIENVIAHYQPQVRLQTLLQQPTTDQVVTDLIALCKLFVEQGLQTHQMGITGSLLINLQHSDSDIDIVFDQRDNFHYARQLIGRLISDNKLQSLTDEHWQQTFIRRGCELNFNDYLWHEQRKNNKALINHRKIDITLSQPNINNVSSRYYKQGKMVLSVKITNADASFDSPAKFLIDHPTINTIICFTATYSGQAKTGEWVEVSGQLEEDDQHQQQIIVGSSREAKGEYIRVIPSS
jgi:predicted nucleotidyltransferase